MSNMKELEASGSKMNAAKDALLRYKKRKVVASRHSKHASDCPYSTYRTQSCKEFIPLLARSKDALLASRGCD